MSEQRPSRAESQSNPSIYVVDDDHELRESLRWVLEADGHRVREFADGESFLTSVDTLHPPPRCLVMDVWMPTMTGLEIQQQLKSLRITIPIVMITGHATIPMAVESIRNGAWHFMEKPVQPEELVAAVAQALDFDRARWKHEIARAEILRRQDTLTPREQEVFELTVAGMNPKQVAAELGIGVKTVHKHRSHVLTKMGVSNAVELSQLMLTTEARLDTTRTGPQPFRTAS